MKGPEQLQAAVRLVLFVVVLSLACNGQAVPAGRGCRNDTDLGPGVSPYDLISGKPPLKDLWSILNIPAKMRVVTSSQFLDAPSDIDCSQDCKAEIVSGDSILAGGNDSIVRVCKQFDQTCRFLVLHSGSQGWRLIDYLDSPYEKYEAPTIRVEASQDRRWLVKTALGGGGTGVYLSVAEWYELQCGSFHLVLTVPLHGDDVNARPARYFSTRFRGFRRIGGRESLEFGYIVRFEDYANQAELWQEERIVVFSRVGVNGPFTFDGMASGISEISVRKVFAFDSMNANDFLDFAYSRLLSIARSPTDSRRAWLGRFLVDLPEDAKVQRFEALLNPRRGEEPK